MNCLKLESLVDENIKNAIVLTHQKLLFSAVESTRTNGPFHKSILKTSQDFPHHFNSNLDCRYWDGYKHSSNFLPQSGYGQATYIIEHAML